MKKKSNLDEHQELELLKIEHNGCWFAFWGLIASMVIQAFIFDLDAKLLAGEWFVFMALALYISIACLKKGIWDRHLKATIGTSLITSGIAGTAMTVFNGLLILKRSPETPFIALFLGIGTGVFTFLLCFIAMEISRISYLKKQKKLEEEPEE